MHIPCQASRSRHISFGWQYKSPELATMSQELVDQDQCASGNAMVLIIEGSGHFVRAHCAGRGHLSEVAPSRGLIRPMSVSDAASRSTVWRSVPALTARSASTRG